MILWADLILSTNRFQATLKATLNKDNVSGLPQCLKVISQNTENWSSGPLKKKCTKTVTMKILTAAGQLRIKTGT